MYAQTMQIYVSHCYEVSCSTLYDQWLDPQSASRWLLTTLDGETPQIQMQQQIGGRFQICQSRPQGDLFLNGQFLQLKRPQQIMFSLENPRLSTEPDLIQLLFQPHPFGCELQVSHQLQFMASKNQQQLIEHWTNIFMRLAANLNNQNSETKKIGRLADHAMLKSGMPALTQ